MKESDIRPTDLFNRYLELAREDCRTLVDKAADFVEAPCPACGRENGSPAFTKLGFDYVLCPGCESLYVSPRPSPELIEEFYAYGKSVAFWSAHFYRETYEARREKIFRPRAELVGDLVRRYAADTSALADIGAGYGMFLEEVERLKIFRRLTAIEPNSRLASLCEEKGFHVVPKRLEEIPHGTVRAGCASAFEIIEHVFSPIDFLRAVRNLIQPSGLIVLTTLTVSGFDIQVLWEKSKSVYPPHHLNLMSVAGLEQLVKRAGFQTLEISTPGLLDVDIVANALKEDPAIAAPRFVRRLVNGDAGTRRNFQEFLRNNRLSSHIRVAARV
jgi:hypothetical protein